MNPTPAPNAAAIEYVANERAPLVTSERKGRGSGDLERLCGKRVRRLVNAIEGVRLARKPRDSMNLPRAPSRPDLCKTTGTARLSSGGHSE
jgi:hypothetical protein